MTTVRKVCFVIVSLSLFLPNMATAQTYGPGNSLNVALPAFPATPTSGSTTLSTACATPLTPLSCASTSYALFTLSNGASTFTAQFNSVNSGVFEVVTSIDGTNFFASLVDNAGAATSLLPSTTISSAGKYNATVGANAYVAVVAITAPSSSVTFFPYLSAMDSGTNIRGSVPLVVSSLPPVVAGSGFPTPLAVQPVSGTVSVTGSFPTPLAVQPISVASAIPIFASTPLPVTGPFPTPLAVQPISGAPTPIPTPVGGVYPISAATALNVNIVGGSSSGATPIPFATNAGGQLLVAAASPFPVTGAFPTPLAVQPVTGTFFQATQPVSIASPVAVTGAFPTPLAVQPISVATALNVNIVGGSSSGATPIPFATNGSGQLVIVAGTPLPVTGSFPTPLAVQPISGAPTPIPYSTGSPLPAFLTNPSLAVTGAFPTPLAVQPVTGTFFQATQPVSIASPVAVTGSFPTPLALQPVSGTVTANAGTGFPTPIPYSTGSPLPAFLTNPSLAVTGAFPTPIPYSTGSPLPAFLTNSSVAVTGSFPTPLAVQPISVATTIPVAISAPVVISSQAPVAVSNFPATQPVSIASPVAVTGSFPTPLAVQPISGAPTPIAYSTGSPLPAFLTNSSIPVTGSFPTPLAVQPVSGTVAVTGSFPTPIPYSTGSPLPAFLTNSSIPVTGSFPTPLAIQPVSGTVTANAGTGYPTPIPTPAGGVYPISAATALAVTGAFPTPLAVQPVSGTITANAGSGFPTPLAVQPISGAPTPIPYSTGSPLPAFLTNSSIAVTGSFPTPLAVQPVTGTFFQTTQPVSIASPVAVTGSFPTPLAVQPVSGTITANAGTGFPTPIPYSTGSPLPAFLTNSSIAVTGSFPTPLAVQPISGAPTPIPTPVGGIYPISATSPIPVTGSFPTPLAVQPVSGTFFQATQPVSIASPVAVTGSFPTPLAVQPVSGTFFQATQPVSIASPVSVTGSFPTPIPYSTGSPLPAFLTNSSIAVTGSFPTPLAVQPISGAPTPIPTPAGGVYPISGAPTPIPTPAGGIYPISATSPIPVTGSFPTPLAVQPVTGTFFQATQPVSIASPVAVTGTFPTPIPWSTGSPEPAYIVNTLPTPIPAPYSMVPTATQTPAANTAYGMTCVYASPAPTYAAGTVGPVTCGPGGGLNLNSVTASISSPYSMITQGQSPQANSAAGMTCVYNSTPPSLTTGQVVPCQTNASGALQVTGQFTVGEPYSMITQGQTPLASSGVGSLCVYNSTAPSLTTGQVVPCQTTSTGAIQVNQANAIQPYSATSSTPIAQSFVGNSGYNGTNVYPMYVDALGVQHMAMCSTTTVTQCATIQNNGAQLHGDTSQTTAYTGQVVGTGAAIQATGTFHILQKILVAVAPTTAAILTCYANTAASGQVIGYVATGSETAGNIIGPFDQVSTTGIYCSGGGAGGTYEIGTL